MISLKLISPDAISPFRPGTIQARSPLLPTPFVAGGRLFVILALAIIAGVHAQSATLYVNGKTGSDSAAGLSPELALRSIQRACDLVQPGDTVIVLPGLYLERVQLRTAGTAQKPIVFKADSVGKKRVILSGAVPAIRTQQLKWQLDDEKLQLYSVPLDFRPARVLYSDADLLPYPTLETLKNFRFADGYPGNKHGFAQETGRLYVRLRGDGRYGPSNPNDHTMAVSTPIGAGHAGLVITKPDDYIFGVLTQKPAHVVIDGFTFETPGTAGVYVDGSYVTVRNCWFLGCRSGVSGIPVQLPGKPNSSDPSKTANNVTIEYCDISSFPTFEDMKEIIAEYRDDPWRGDRKSFQQKIYWWQRKDHIGYKYTYETGIGTFIGSDWVIRNNYMHDSVEYLSTSAARWSRNLQVYQNRFERLVDNAIEAEDHAYNERFFDNVIVDVFEPFSWQPLGGLPWPGPVYFYRNVVWMTPENQGVWKNADWAAGIWKLGAQENNWTRKDIEAPPQDSVRAEGEGFLAFNNTIYCPDHIVLTRVQKRSRKLENFHIFNNLVVLNDFSRTSENIAEGIDFHHNVGAFAQSTSSQQIANFVGKGGESVNNPTEIGVLDTAIGQLELTKDRPLGVTDFGLLSAEALPTAGAVLFGKKWTPPTVGPQVMPK